MRPRLILPLLIALGACGEDPSVNVSTHVGQADPQEDPEASWEDARRVLSAATAAWHPVREVQASPEGVTHPPRTKDELELLMRELRRGPLEEIAGPASRIAASTPDLWPVIQTAMLAERKSPKGDYRSLLSAIGGDVPNKYGTFKLAWKKAHGYQVKLSEDWFADLLALPRSKVSSGLRKVYRDCVLEAALLRAAANVARERPEMAGDVVASLLDAAYLHRGTFRDEVGRAIRSIGDAAVPHLVRGAIMPEDARRDMTAIPVRKAEYARVQLDRMDRLHPSKALRAVRDDPTALARLLRAYGEARTEEAADPILDYADSPTPRVRQAAREAFLTYVTGEAPRAVQRTVKTLGGGRKTAQAYMSYRGRAALAIRDRLQQEAPALLEPECEVRREDGTYDQACMEQPARHAEAYLGYLDLRRRSDQSRSLAVALAASDPAERITGLDRLLAAGLEIDALGRMIPEFREAARRAADGGEPRRAAQLYRKSAMLLDKRAPGEARGLRVEALLAEASTENVGPRGRAMLLHSAAELDAQDPRVQAALAAIDAESMATTTSPERLWLGTLAALLGLLCLGWIATPLRRRALGH